MGLHLVTGGSGFVGSHTAEYLLRRGEGVRIFDTVRPDVPGADALEEAEYFEGDVRDRDALKRAMEGVDYVHHNVALVPLTKAGDVFREVNVDGTRNVMCAALEAGVDGVTHISSSAVYDISSMPVSESTPVSPIGRYGQSKLEGDHIALDYAERGLPVNILRPRTVLDERRAGIYQILFDWVEHDKRIYMLGDGINEFQLVSARDLADASYLAATADFEGEIFNIGNERYNTLGEDLRHLIDHADSDSSILWVPPRPVSLVLQFLDKVDLSPLAPWHYKTVYRDYYFDITKAKEKLGWEPSDSNFEMFERAYDWYESNDIEAAAEEGSVHRTAPKQKILALVRRFS
jgi:nucleoside-diphosphate-sugar epimerase